MKELLIKGCAPHRQRRRKKNRIEFGIFRYFVLVYIACDDVAFIIIVFVVFAVWQ